jgi:cytochrome c peroxidase
MGATYRLLTVGKAAGLSAALAVILCASASTSNLASDARQAWMQKYLRPAEIPFPERNPYSNAKYNLGRTLFFDPLLSGSEVRSCASCHNPGLSWSDGQARAIGEKQQPLALRSPTLLNVAWVPKLGWDGHFRDLESVAMGPITAPGNMNLPESTMIERLAAIPGYVDAFDAAFGEGEITARKIEFALATFERTIVSKGAPFDRWIAGDETAISEDAKRGFDLFNGKAGCVQCHSEWNFTDNGFHDVGLVDSDRGRGERLPLEGMQFAFKTPTLRNVDRRAPYMHEGNEQTLADVIEFYNRGGDARRNSLSPEIVPLHLNAQEKTDLLAFLRTLTSVDKPVEFPIFPR